MSALAVFVHGYHIGAANWTEVCWGTPPHALGRGPAALRAALDLDADLLVFGMGGPKSRHNPYFPDAIYTTLLERCAELAGFDAFTDDDVDRARSLLLTKTAFVHDANGSTRGELFGLRDMLERLAIRRVALVSSPDHMPRVLRDAHTVFRDTAVTSLIGMGAQTMFCDLPPVIVEEPHRPDRAQVSLRDVCAQLLALDDATRRDVLDRIRGAVPPTTAHDGAPN